MSISTNKSSARLKAAHKRLEAAWTKFQSVLPREQRLAFKKEPDFSVVLNTVQNAIDTQVAQRVSTRTGKAKELLTRLMRHVKDHEGLIKIIPTDDKYVSIIANSFLAISNAFVQHEDVGQAIMDALDELNLDIDFWKRQMTIHRDSESMQYFIIEAHVTYFEMLTDIFAEWSSSSFRRFRRSFNEGWPQKMKDKQTKIAQLKSRLESEAKLSTEKTVQDMSTQLSHMPTEFRLIVESCLANFDFDAAIQSKLHLLQQSGLQIGASTTPAQAGGGCVNPDNVSNAENPITNQNIAVSEPNFSLMDTFMNREHQRGVREACPRSNMSTDARQAIKRWLKPDHVQKSTPRRRQHDNAGALWIEGPADTETPSTDTAAAAALMTACQNLGISSISHFCTHTASFRRKREGLQVDNGITTKNSRSSNRRDSDGRNNKNSGSVDKPWHTSAFKSLLFDVIEQTWRYLTDVRLDTHPAQLQKAPSTTVIASDHNPGPSPMSLSTNNSTINPISEPNFTSTLQDLSLQITNLNNNIDNSHPNDEAILDEALDIFESLLQLVSTSSPIPNQTQNQNQTQNRTLPLLIFILSNINLLELRSNKPHTRHLRRFLTILVDSSSADTDIDRTKIKILFTTDGTSDLLGKMLINSNSNRAEEVRKGKRRLERVLNDNDDDGYGGSRTRDCGNEDEDDNEVDVDVDVGVGEMK